MNNAVMDAIPQINNPESLDLWLHEGKHGTGQQMAARAAMRALPIGWHWLISSTGAEVTLPLLFCAFHAASPPEVSAKKLPHKVQTALFYSTDYSTRALATRHRGPSVVLAAINSAATATTLPIPRATRHASLAFQSAASAFDLELAKPDAPESLNQARQGFWSEVRADCTLMCENTELRTAPLWSEQPSPFDAHWKEIKIALQGKPEWENWLLWYETVLNGDPFTLDLLAES